MSEITIHHLIGKDLSTLTGDCSVCGLVAIRKAGRGFMCAEKKKQAQNAWRAANPEKVRANRRARSDHELTQRDYVRLSAWCVKCRVWVAMTPWGRGYTCATRAAELRSVQEAAPAKPCRECWILDASRVYLVDGQCPRCSDPRLYDTGAALRDAELRAGDLDGVPAGYATVDLETFDAYDAAESESVVPGWRTIGTSRPWNEV